MSKTAALLLVVLSLLIGGAFTWGFLSLSGSIDDHAEAILGRLTKLEEELSRRGPEPVSTAPRAELREMERQRPTEAEFVYGHPAAPVTLIEFTDFECPYCKTFFPTAKEVVDSMKGAVNLVLRPVALRSHGQAAVEEALAVECAGRVGGNAAYWRLAEAIFQYTASNGNGIGQPLSQLAAQLGVDERAFTACLSDGALVEVLQQTAREAQEHGVQMTPATVVRSNQTGRTSMIGGVANAEQLMRAIAGVISQ